MRTVLFFKGGALVLLCMWALFGAAEVPAPFPWWWALAVFLVPDAVMVALFNLGVLATLLGSNKPTSARKV